MSHTEHDEIQRLLFLIGCHFCTAEGVTIGKTHGYYPYHKSGQLRDASINNLFVYYAENFDAEKPLNVVGVKGPSAFADLVDASNSPHCLYALRVTGGFSGALEIML